MIIKLNESLKEDVNEKYNWFLVNNSGKTVSVLPESDCDDMIEDFVIDMLFDEVVTDEEDEDLYDNDPEEFYQKYGVKEQMRAAKYDLTYEGEGLEVSRGRYIIMKDADYEGDLPYNYYIEGGCLYNPSGNCVGKLENVSTKPNTVFSWEDIDNIVGDWLSGQDEVRGIKVLPYHDYHVYGVGELDYNIMGKHFEEYFKETFGWNVSHGDSTRIKYVVSCLQPNRSKGDGFDIIFTQEDDYDNDEMYVEIDAYDFDLTENFYGHNTSLDETRTLQENNEPYVRYRVKLTPYKNMIKFDFIDELFDKSDYCFCNESGYVKTQYSGCTEKFFNKIWNKDMKPNKAYDVLTDGPYGEVIGFREIPLSRFK